MCKAMMRSRRWVALIWMSCWALCAGCSFAPAKKEIPLLELEHQILFVYRDWHTSIVLNTDTYLRYSKLAPQSSLLQTTLSGQRYIRVGWGDGIYFTGKSKTLGAATKALFASEYSALQLIGYKTSPYLSIPKETIAPLMITEAAMGALVAYIDQSFLVNEQDELILLPAYVTDAGQFFKATQSYGLFSNCNTWSGRALQAAGIPIHSRLHLTAQSVFEQVQKVSQRQVAAGVRFTAE